jgi:hypothetical protein
VWFVLDATHTFDIAAPDGEVVPAAEIARMTGINLQGEFAEVVTTAAAVSALRWTIDKWSPIWLSPADRPSRSSRSCGRRRGAAAPTP